MCGKGNIVKGVGESARGVVQGFAKGLWSTCEGVYNMVAHPLDTFGGLATLAGVAVVGYSSPGMFGSPKERLKAFDSAFGTHLSDVDAGIRQSLSDTGDTMLHGSNEARGEIVGQMIEFVAEIAVGTKGTGAAMKSVKSGSMGAKMAKAAETVDKVNEVISKTGGKLQEAIQEKLPEATKGVFGKKPPNSPDIKKWIGEKGGKVEKLEDGTWRYTDWEGNVVDYVDGYPVFKEPHLRQSVDIGKQKGNYTSDFKNAEAASKKIPPKLDIKETVWHHNEDGKTMQEVDREIHRRFTHRGGVSATKKTGGKVSLGKKK
jgi:hypothetical protein